MATDRESFIAEGKAKIEALFDNVAEHSSASIIDVKRAFLTMIDHFTQSAPHDVEDDDHELTGSASNEPPAGTPLTPEELVANHVETVQERSEPPVEVAPESAAAEPAPELPPEPTPVVPVEQPAAE